MASRDDLNLYNKILSQGHSFTKMHNRYSQHIFVKMKLLLMVHFLSQYRPNEKFPH